MKLNENPSNLNTRDKSPETAKLIKDLTKWNWEVRLEAAKKLGELKAFEGIEPLIQALKDKHSFVRAMAAFSLGKINNKKAVEPIYDLLQDEDDEVFCEVALALAEFGDKRAIIPLTIALQSPHDYIRFEAAEALVIFGDKDSVDPLISALWDYNNVRSAAIGALGKIGDVRALPFLEKIISSTPNNERLKAEAVKAYEQIKENITL